MPELASPWLIVGLGNPGARYESHRHNIGFMVVERWRDRHTVPGADDWREKFHGRFDTIKGRFGRAIVLEPLTYMNRSGQSVAAAKAFFNVELSHVVVVHDELDFDFGRMAIKAGGGHGGHNGLRDIIATCGRDFTRIRVGIGRPHPPQREVADWVLSDFTSDEASGLSDVIHASCAALDAIVTDGVRSAMNRMNTKASPKATPPAADS